MMKALGVPIPVFYHSPITCQIVTIRNIWCTCNHLFLNALKHSEWVLCYLCHYY